jgi:Tfp pilus assembly protein PilO
MFGDRDQLKVLAVLLIVVGGFGAGIWLPARAERQTLQKRITEARQKLAKARESPSLRKWNQAVGNLRTKIDQSRQRVPRQDEMAEVLRGLSEVLNTRHVDDREVMTRDMQRFGRFGLIPIEVTFRGTFKDAYAVMQRIEQMPRLVQVDRLELGSNQRAEEQGLSVQLKLSAFFARREQAKP